MAAEWGKKAVGRIDRSQFENDELLKSLGNQLNVDFSNYDQWKRKERVMRPLPPKKKPQETFKVGLLNRTTSADSAPTPVPRGRRAQAQQEEERRIKQERLNMYELKIQNAKLSFEMYKKRAKELSSVDTNLQIARDIESKEQETHAEVKRLLRKYEKFRGGIATLNTNFVRELSEATGDLDRTKETIKIKLEALQKELNEMDIRLKAKQDELNVLHSYKDKEYPVKAMMIANLHTEIESVKNTNQEDREELEHIINNELGKYDKKRIELANEITRKVTEESVAMMHPSLKDMALQNMVMKKEIEFHMQQQEELLCSNKQLQEEVQQLVRHPKSNLRLQLFPEFFPTKEKCTPDMDVVLDIPKQEWLPI